MLTDTTEAGRSLAEPSASIVHLEQNWFALPGTETESCRVPRFRAGRWTGYTQDEREEHAQIGVGYHVIGIALRPMNVTAFAERKLIHTGLLPQGAMRVNEPGIALRGIFRGNYDVLHLHIPNAVITEYSEAEFEQNARGGTLSFPNKPTVDPILSRLAHAFLEAEGLGGAFGRNYADGIGLAITARLFGRYSNTGASLQPSSATPLIKWRLKRATEYIAAHLSDTIGLADIAASTGLTRMYFAAQFRAATGMRPHEYVLRRRIERAQELLLTSRLPLAEVALDVGFKAQPHFTTVFARFVGVTPHVWRQQNRAA
jgi:AraC family transcriptional regulator